MQRRGSLNSAAASSRIRVAVRVRPPDAKIPKDATRPPCVVPHAHAPNAVAFHHEEQAKTFTFDHVFGPEATQEDLYANALQPLMAQFLDGFNVTVMAYGQTGSGKTYTMGNKATVFNTTPTTSPGRERASSLPAPTIVVPEVKSFRGSAEDGLMPRFLNDLFVNLKKEPSIRDIRVTFVEIYCDTIRDLLDDRVNKTLTIRDDSHNVWVENVRSVQVETLSRALEVLNAGRARQTVGVNALNDESSRSHAVYTMEVTRKFLSETKKSKVTFVDLAGSERIKKTQVEGVRKRESIQINMGLSALGNVINALADEKKMQRRSNQDSASRPSSPDAHIPYRSSKLTRLLRDGLGGNARTLFIACVSPLDSNADETLITLQFANRARNIQNKAEKCVIRAEAIVEVPLSPRSLEISCLQEEVRRLTCQIEELEQSARKRDEEIAANEHERSLRKQRKVDSRRDVEMTTEITIFPQIDAHTQFEGESTREQEDKFVDKSTSTEVIDEVILTPKRFFEVSIQTDWKPSHVEAEVMTDRDLSAEAWTDSSDLRGVLVDSAVQIYPTRLQLSDIQLPPESWPAVECVDQSTEPQSVDCKVDAGTDPHEFVAEDVRLITNARATVDACTQLDVPVSMEAGVNTNIIDSVDTAIQSEVAVFVEVEVSTDSCVAVDSATQPDAPKLVEVETYTDAKSGVHVATQFESLLPIDAAPTSANSLVTRSEMTMLNDVETCTEATEIVEGATHIQAMTSAAMATTVDENQALGVANPIGVLCVEAALAVTRTRNDAETFTGIDPITMMCDVSTWCAPICCVDAGVQFDSSSEVLATQPLTHREPDSLPLTSLPSSSRNVCPTDFQHATFSTLSESVTAGCVQDDCNESIELSIPKEEDSISTPSNDHSAKLTLTGGLSKHTLSENESSKMDQFPFEIEQDFKLEAAVLTDHYECSRPISTYDNTIFQSDKTRRSLTPEIQEEEKPKDSSERSENQLEAGEPGPFAFVCNPVDEDDNFHHDVTTRTAQASGNFVPAQHTYGDDNECFHDGPIWAPDTALPALLPVSVRSSLSDTDLKNQDEIDDPACTSRASLKPPLDFVSVRSPRAIGDNQRSPLPSPRGTMSRHWLSSPCHQTVRPLRIFTFDDDVATGPSEKTAARAMRLYEELRQIAEDEFGSTLNARDEVEDLLDYSPVCQLMSETRHYIDQRYRRQQRISQLRRRVLSLEEVLCIENRAPISEPELKAYSLRVQEEFLGKLLQQLITLAAQRLHSRLKARIEAEQSVPLSSHDEDLSNPFLSLDQCHACAEWFFHRPTDSEYFDKLIMPLVSNGWISLTPEDLEREQAWFQL